MTTYSISVTTLESFRRYMAGVSPWDTEQSVVDKLTGKFIGNDKTKIGGAFHKIIENRISEPQDITVMGVAFSMNQCRAACEYVKQHPNMVNEVPGRILYETHSFYLQVTGRADGIEGIEIRDAKTKFSSPNWMEYYQSYQWRFYLDMFKTDMFWYDVFEIKGYMGKGIMTGAAVVPHDPFQCLRYDHMSDDLQELVDRFSNWILAKNYQNLLKQIK